MALIALGLTPFMLIAVFVSTKADQGVKREDNKEEADLLASDAISNFRIVASFGCDKIIVNKYTELNEIPFQNEQKKST